MGVQSSTNQSTITADFSMLGRGLNVACIVDSRFLPPVRPCVCHWHQDWSINEWVQKQADQWPVCQQGGVQWLTYRSMIAGNLTCLYKFWLGYAWHTTRFLQPVNPCLCHWHHNWRLYEWLRNVPHCWQTSQQSLWILACYEQVWLWGPWHWQGFYHLSNIVCAIGTKIEV